jgi:RAQPRD family integrative conjugative element protein
MRSPRRSHFEERATRCASQDRSALRNLRVRLMTTMNPTAVRRWFLLLTGVVLLAHQAPVTADGDAERERLAAVVRQLDTLDDVLNSGADQPRHDGRYYFDYARLREDLARVRAGIRDYLTPQRAQPRDPVPLLGDYRRESDSEDAP